MKHFTAVADCTPDELRHMLDVAYRLKRQLRETGRNDPVLAGKTLALVFEKPSLRTRVSFSVAMTHLGGEGLILRDEEVGLGKREPVQDVARVLSGMVDGIMARTFEHEKVTSLARHATVPVINGLTDLSHPCQAMADVMTLEEHFGAGKLAGRTLAFIGDGNNVARSLAVACGKFGMRFILAAPPGYELPGDDVDRIMAQVPEMDFELDADPRDAVRNADCVVTDTWVSMGQETTRPAGSRISRATRWTRRCWPRRPRTPSCSTAFRPTAGTRSAKASSRAHGRSCSRKQRTGCTSRRP
jgi:ornithine carbamoyltransferase